MSRPGHVRVVVGNWRDSGDAAARSYQYLMPRSLHHTVFRRMDLYEGSSSCLVSQDPL